MQRMAGNGASKHGRVCIVRIEGYVYFFKSQTDSHNAIYPCICYFKWQMEDMSSAGKSVQEKPTPDFFKRTVKERALSDPGQEKVSASQPQAHTKEET